MTSFRPFHGNFVPIRSYQKCCPKMLCNCLSPLCKSLVKLMAQFRNICILSTISCQLYFLHQHSSTKGENIQRVRSSSYCHLDLIVLIDLQEKVKPNSDGSSPFALKGFGYPSTSNTCETVNQPLLKIVPAASSISLESIRNNFKPLPIMQVLFLSFIRNGAANSTVQGTSGLEYLPCAIGRAHQLALCSSSQPFGSGAFFLAKNLITSVAPSENPQRCLQLAQGNPGFFFRFSCN